MQDNMQNSKPNPHADRPTKTSKQVQVQEDSSLPVNRPSRVKRNRLARRLIALLCFSIILLALAIYILTGTWFLKPRIEPVLSTLSGGNATIGSVRYHGGGRIVLHNITVRIPGVSGIAGEWLQIPNAEVFVDASRLLSGEIIPRKLILKNPTIRFSEDIDNGFFNMSRLEFDNKTTTDQSESVALPEIQLHDLILELGEHSGSKYTKSDSLTLNGIIFPEISEDTNYNTFEDRQWYQFELQEFNDPNNQDTIKSDDQITPVIPQHINIRGRFNPTFSEGTATIEGITFDRDRTEILPRAVRHWWQIIKPSGNLDPIQIVFLQNGDYRVDVPMDGIDWTIPIQELNWFSNITSSASTNSDIHDITNDQLESPRLTKVRGTVTLKNSGIELIGMEGNLGEIRYSVRGGFDAANKNTDFHLNFRTDEFIVSKELSILNTLPSDIRTAIQSSLLSVEDTAGTMIVHVDVQRNTLATTTKLSDESAQHSPDNDPQQGQGTTHSPTPLQISGSVQLKNIEVYNDNFPYPIRGLTGEISFNENEIRIDSLRGIAQSGGSILVNGLISPPGLDPTIDLNVVGYGIPIDDTLRHALGEQAASILDLFFNAAAAQRLEEAHVFLRPEEHDALQARLDTLHHTLRMLRILPEGDNTQDNLIVITDDEAYRNSTIKQLKLDIEDIQHTLDDIPVFKMGGKLILEASIKRKAGEDDSFETVLGIGPLRRQDPINALYRNFPYPVQVVDGQLTLKAGAITITKPLELRSPSCPDAIGWLSGDIKQIHDGSKFKLKPDLIIKGSGVQIDSMLTYAIPAGARGYQTPAGDDPAFNRLAPGGAAIAGLQLEGMLSGNGTITTNEMHKAKFQINVDLANAHTRNVNNPLHDPNDIKWSWPFSKPLSNVTASVIISESGLHILDIKGAHNDELMSASGFVHWGGGQDPGIDILIDGENISINTQILQLTNGLLSKEHTDRLSKFLTEYQPEGRMSILWPWTQTFRSKPASQQQDHSDGITIWPDHITAYIKNNRISFYDSTGEIRLHDGYVILDNLVADIRNDNLTPGTLALDGKWMIDAAPPNTNDSTELDPCMIVGTLLNTPYQSSLIRTALAISESEGLLQQFDDLNLAGRFDANFQIVQPIHGMTTKIISNSTHDAYSHTEYTNDVQLDWQVDLYPRFSAFTWNSTRYEVGSFQGGIQLTPNMVLFQDLQGKYQDGSFGIDGNVILAPAIQAELQLDLNAKGITERVVAILPVAVKQMINHIKLEVKDSVHLSNAKLIYQQIPVNPPVTSDATTAIHMAHKSVETLKFDGLLNINNASLHISLPITNVDGDIAVHISKDKDDTKYTVWADMHFDRLRAERRLVTDVDVELRQGNKSGQIIFPLLHGLCYEGEVSGKGRILYPTLFDPGDFAFWLTMTDVSIDQFLVEPELSLDVSNSDTTDNTINSDPHTYRPGIASGSLSLSGIFGDVNSRIGRGEFRILDAELYDVPLAMWVLQLSSLALPVSTSFNFADINFYLQGDRITFDRLFLESPTLTMTGHGDLYYITRELDLRFESANRARTPVVSDLIEGFRDSLFSIHVTGNLDDPVSELQSSN